MFKNIRKKLEGNFFFFFFLTSFVEQRWEAFVTEPPIFTDYFDHLKLLPCKD